MSETLPLHHTWRTKLASVISSAQCTLMVSTSYQLLGLTDELSDNDKPKMGFQLYCSRPLVIVTSVLNTGFFRIQVDINLCCAYHRVCH